MLELWLIPFSGEPQIRKGFPWPHSTLTHSKILTENQNKNYILTCGTEVLLPRESVDQMDSWEWVTAGIWEVRRTNKEL